MSIVGDKSRQATIDGIRSAAERVIRNVVVDHERGCWEWQGCVNRKGYGRILVGRSARATHRVMYQAVHGVISKDTFVCHVCDNPTCVNPDHLWAGSHQDNMNDMKTKGRSPSSPGERNGRAKLTESTVVEIRTRHSGGESIRSLSRNYNVDKRTVSRLIRKLAWASVP